MATGRVQGGLYYDAERRDMERRDRDMIPKPLVIALAGLALVTLLIVSYSVMRDVPKAGMPPAAETVAARTVVLESDGVALRVTEPDGTLIVERDNGAFISVVISALQRSRTVNRVEGNPPVTVSRLANGRLTLSDPATGWIVELTSFGVGNAAYWNWILPN